MLLLKVDFLILENLIPLLLVLLMLLGHVERTRLEFNDATWLVVLRAELKLALELQGPLRLDALGPDRCRHITAMLRRLVDIVFHVGSVVLLQDLLLVRHGEVHDSFNFGAASRTRVEADTLLFLLHNDFGQLVDTSHPLNLMKLNRLLVRPVIITT